MTTRDGRGLRNARVVINHLNGTSTTVLTSSFGYYSFPSLLADGMHSIIVNSKRYRFDSQYHEFTGDSTAINFIGEE